MSPNDPDSTKELVEVVLRRAGVALERVEDEWVDLKTWVYTKVDNFQQVSLQILFRNSQITMCFLIYDNLPCGNH